MLFDYYGSYVFINNVVENINKSAGGAFADLIKSKIILGLQKKLFQILLDLYINKPINFISNALPSPLDESIPYTVHTMLNTLENVAYGNTEDLSKGQFNDFFTDQLKNTIIFAGDEAILSAFYIPTTQAVVNDVATKASSNDYSSTSTDAYSKLLSVDARDGFVSVKENSDESTQKSIKKAELAINVGHVTNTLSDIADAGSLVGLPALKFVALVLKGVSLGSYLSAVIIPSKNVYDIQHSFSNHVSIAFHPEVYEIQPKKVSPEFGHRRRILYSQSQVNEYEEQAQKDISDYNQLLQQLVSLVKEGKRSDALIKIAELLDQDENLNQSSQTAEAPIFARTDSAFSDSTFQQKYFSLSNTTTKISSSKFNLYTQLLAYAVDSSATYQSISVAADSLTNHLNEASDLITKVNQDISNIPAPAFVVVTKDSLSKSIVNSSIPFTIYATVKNIGTLPAKSVKVSLETDSLTTLQSQQSFTISSLDVGQTQSLSWSLVTSDTVSASKTYLISLHSDSSKVESKTGLFDVKSNTNTTGISRFTTPVPSNYKLAQNYPNPFNPTTNIRYTLPTSQHVTLQVYNTLGQLVATLVNKDEAAGEYSVTFNADKLPSGLYIYRLKAENYTETKKMMLIK